MFELVHHCHYIHRFMVSTYFITPSIVVKLMTLMYFFLYEIVNLVYNTNYYYFIKKRYITVINFLTTIKGVSSLKLLAVVVSKLLIIVFINYYCFY